MENMGTVYAYIAEKYNTNSEAVRNNMRFAIEGIWTTMDAVKLEKLYPFEWNREHGRPSNSEFVHNIANLI